MNLQQLEYFKKIAETENFTAASTLLSVTQPALSKAIAKLEEELHVPLFEKSGRNIKLTSFGKAFLKHANLALSEIQKGIDQLQNMSNIDNGIISMASTFCIGNYFMPFIISDYLSLNPDTRFQFNHESVPEILKDLKEKRIVLGFYDSIDNIHTQSEIISIPVRKEEYVLIVSKNNPLASKATVSLKDLKNESFIVFNEENKDKLLSFSELLKYTPKISLQANQASMVGTLVAAGAGIAIVANTPLINTNKLSILKIEENIGYKTIYMGWLKDSYMPPMAKKFKDYVISTTLYNIQNQQG